MNPRKWILLAEDDECDADLAMRALASTGASLEILLAADGSEVLDCLHERNTFSGRATGNPSLVLLDLKMPRVDGIEVLRQMKENPRFRCIPAVIFTSSREERDLSRTYELGANAYVVKPLNFREMIRTLTAVSNFWMALNEPPPESDAGADETTAVLAQSAPRQDRKRGAVASREE